MQKTEKLNQNTESVQENNTSSELELVEAIVSYLRYHRSLEDQNFAAVSKLYAVAYPDGYGVSPLDKIFDDVKAKNPDDVCVKQYEAFKQIRKNIMSA